MGKAISIFLGDDVLRDLSQIRNKSDFIDRYLRYHFKRPRKEQILFEAFIDFYTSFDKTNKEYRAIIKHETNQEDVD